MSAKVHGWRRPVRWARNIVLGIVGVIAVVVLGAFLFFETSPGRDVLRSQIESRMNAALVGGAKLGGVEGNPLTTLVLRDLVINGPDKQPAIAIKRLTIKLPLMPLISHQLRVDEIIAEDPDITVKKLPDGRINVASLTKPTAPSTWNIKLPNTTVHRGHVRLELGGDPVDLDHLELFVDAALPFAGPIDAALSLSGDWRQKKAPIDVAASVHIDDETALVNQAAIQLGDIDVAVNALSVARGPFMQPVGGVVSVYAPQHSIHDLAPTVHVPGDVALLLTARPDGRLSHITVGGAVGRSRVDVVADADIQAKLAHGTIRADALDLTALSSGKLVGHGRANLAFDVDGNEPAAEFPTAHVRGTVDGEAGKVPPLHAAIDLSTEGDRLAANIKATATNGVNAALDAVIRKQGEHVVLERGHLVAAAADARRATQGLAPLRGSLDANLEASGQLAPRVDLAVTGHANGRDLRMNDISADSFALRIDARHVPSRFAGSGRIEVTDLRRGTMELGKLTVAAGNRPDGKLQVSVRSQPKRAPWLIDLDALVAMGPTTTIDLQRHFVRAAGGSVWRGDRGTLTITSREIKLRDFATRSGDGRIAADASFVRAGRGAGDLTAKVAVHDIDLANLEKAYRGKVDATIDVTRTRGRLAGIVDAKATGVSLDPKSPITLDGNVHVDAKPGSVVGNLDLAAANAGRATVAFDVAAPRDLTNARGWSKLDRHALNHAQIKLAGVDLAQLSKLAGARPMAGHVDGDIELDRDTTGGLIKLRGVQTEQIEDLGTLEADLRVGEAGKDEVRTTLTAHLQPTPSAIAAKDVTKDGAARLYVDAKFQMPDHLFDPVAWKRLGADAFRGGSLRAERLAFQPGTLERLGIISDMRGELAVGAELDEGMRAARLVLNVYGLRGGLFAHPIDVNLSAVLDDKSSRMTGTVVAQNTTLLKLTGHIPVTLAELRANPHAAKTAPLAATAVIDNVPAQTFLFALGTSQVNSGWLHGKITAGGTVARPTVDANIEAHDVSVPQEGSKPTQMIEHLVINGSWDGSAGKLTVDGKQNAGGIIALRAAGSPDDLAAVGVSFTAKKLDLAPLVAFMPGPAGGLGGELEANLQLKGADPRTADLSGSLHIINGRVPIAPAVGTLFQGDVKIDIRNRNLGVNVTGKLGRGDVKLVANAPLDGITPKNGKATVTLHKVQLIGTTEPIISGAINADVARVDAVWRANIKVDRMTVKIPETKGHKLSPAGAPPDLVYGGPKLHHQVKNGTDAPRGIVHDDGPADFKPPAQVEGPIAKRKEPDEPVADVKVVIRNVFVESKDVRGLLGGNLKATIAGDKQVAVVGQIGMTRGVLELFNRRYEVDKANLLFDGSVDPELDVRIMHDFPEVTTITEVRGRMSKPQLILSSQPAQYTQAELLGFLLGGEPGGDPENAPSATSRVANAGVSFIGNKVSGYVKKALPVDIDVLRYETASSTSSAAVTVGTWITDTLFLAYRRHLEARPDENAGEGELEYWLRRRLVLEAVAGDRGVNGLDLLWRRRW